jgi:putative restriction endonuclease
MDSGLLRHLMPIEAYIEKFSNLRTDKNRNRYPASTRHCAPHKPILLLAVMDLVEQGFINNNFIEPTMNLVDTFNTYVSLVLPAGWKTSMAHPFPRLQKDGFWHRVTNPGYDPEKDYNVTSIAKLNEIYAGARLDDELFVLMLDPESRTRLRTALIDTYFTSEFRPVLLEQAGVNLTAYQYSQKLLEEVKESGKTWEKSEESTKNQKIRDQGFRKVITQLYDHRCALCGIRMITPEGHTIVEAAHIKPWHKSNDDRPTNGLALCRLCHWSFDEGLMSVSRNYEVLVSKRVRTDRNMPGHIMTLEKRPIFRPEDEVCWPATENIAWHQKHTFK